MMEYSRSAALQSGSGGWHSCQSRPSASSVQFFLEFNLRFFVMLSSVKAPNEYWDNKKKQNQEQLAFGSAANHWNHSGLMIWNLNMGVNEVKLLDPKRPQMKLLELQVPNNHWGSTKRTILDSLQLNLRPLSLLSPLPAARLQAFKGGGHRATLQTHWCALKSSSQCKQRQNALQAVHSFRRLALLGKRPGFVLFFLVWVFPFSAFHGCLLPDFSGFTSRAIFSSELLASVSDSVPQLVLYFPIQHTFGKNGLFSAKCTSLHFAHCESHPFIDVPAVTVELCWCYTLLLMNVRSICCL